MRKLAHDEITRPDPAALASLPKHPIAVMLDNIRSMHNVGSIFRTSDAARVEHLYLAGITATPDHPGMHRTALGSQDSVPWSHAADAADVVRGLRERGYRIAVLEITDRPTAAEALTEADFPLVLVVGNEVEGVSEDVLALADIALEIPQFGMKQSLNVSVAYGIAAFDLVRRFRALHPDRVPLR
jgi:tRNA G18 (ribose-2'-O)-methylase SpoU